MKKEYSKPVIHVEILAMDTPVAGACDTSLDFELPELNAQGWFVGEQNCGFDYFEDEQGGVIEMDKYGDTICYHSHAKTVFQS